MTRTYRITTHVLFGVAALLFFGAIYTAHMILQCAP